MKKMIVLALTIIMLISVFTAGNAETGEEIFDMEHGTAMIWLNDEPYEFEIESSSEEDGLILAAFAGTDNDLTLVMAMQNDLSANYYESAENSDDLYAVVIFEPDGTNHYASCSSSASKEGYGCDLCMTVYDESGWYQGIVIGNTACDENGETFEIICAFDMILESGHVENACSTCKGTGSCIFCENGNCIYCAVDTNYCYCLGGRCYICDGIGYTRGYTYGYGTTYDECSSCGGTGIHTYCGGTGTLPCVACYGTGSCSHCYGSSHCSDCHGTGMN